MLIFYKAWDLILSKFSLNFIGRIETLDTRHEAM